MTNESELPKPEWEVFYDSTFTLDKDPEEIISDLKRAIRRAQHRGDTFSLRALLSSLSFLFERLGRMEDALLCYRRIIKLDPNDITAWYGAVVRTSALGRYAEVRKLLKDAMLREFTETTPFYRPRLSYQAAVVSVLTGRFEDAEKLLDELLSREFAVRETRILLEYSRFRLGKSTPEALIAAAAAELDLEGRTAVPAAALAVALYEKGDLQESRKWRKTALAWAGERMGEPLVAQIWQLTYSILKYLPEEPESE